MTTWRGSTLRCPHCQAPVDSMTDFTLGHPPLPGDASMCFYCGDLGMFAQVMGVMVLVPLPAHLLAQAEADPHIQQVRAELRRIQQMRAELRRVQRPS